MQILTLIIVLPLALILSSCANQSTGVYRDENGYSYPVTQTGCGSRVGLGDQNGYVYTPSNNCCHYGYYNNGNYNKGRCNEGCYNISCCGSIWR